MEQQIKEISEELHCGMKCLIEALNKRRLFANFKQIVENSSHREAWFAFRDEAQQN